MLDLQECLAVAEAAARAAGALIAAGFHAADKGVQQKGVVTDLVTETDQRAEQLISQHLKQAFPDHLFIGEETAAASGGQGQLTEAPTWMVDPLDGTTNFVHGFPFPCVSIGLAVQREPVVGVVFNPILQECFAAVKGGGATLNGRPIRCSQETELVKALFATEIGTSRQPDTVAAMFDRLQALTSRARSVRCCGSCAMNLCGVACGRLDAFYEIGFGGCWDVAAGAVIVREAGGVLLDPAGAPWDVMGRRVLAANPHLAPAVAAVLAQCKTSPHEPPPPPSGPSGP